MMKITKKHIKETFKTKLASNATWATRGMLKIYERQTAQEQASQTTQVINDVGFSGCDAEILSSFCEQYMKWGRLSDKQMTLVFKKMPKYWSQLVSISDQAKVETLVAATVTE